MKLHLGVLQRIDPAAGIAAADHLDNLAQFRLEGGGDPVDDGDGVFAFLSLPIGDELSISRKVENFVPLLVVQLGGRPDHDARIVALGEQLYHGFVGHWRGAHDHFEVVVRFIGIDGGQRDILGGQFPDIPHPYEPRDVPSLPGEVDGLIARLSGGVIFPWSDKRGDLPEDRTVAIGQVNGHLTGTDGPCIETDQMIPCPPLHDFV